MNVENVRNVLLCNRQNGIYTSFTFPTFFTL